MMESIIRTVDAEVADFAAAVTRGAGEVLGDNLHAAYLSGSVALGGYVPGQSDIDIMAVCRHPLPDERKRKLADAVSHVADTCPTRGLEFVLYSRGAVATPSRSPRFEINLNAGPEMPYHLSLDPASEPSHWFVLDVSIAREHGLRLAGPPSHEVFAPIPRSWLLDALEDSLVWHAEHETLTHYSVLNACRAWRFAEEGVWSSKEAGAKWARPRVEDPTVIDAALEIRRGQARRLDPSEVRAFVMGVRSRVARIPR
ncbi:MAG TPA: aminoglycoside adenylyltransferase domain-containing protein [Rubrobacteraceae bacterium]|nr:aminoglycoside adenylyltransferase domain-containing protein [Rubrobacteraceae bacterium]